MVLSKSLTKEIFIRLVSDEAFVSTVKYGCIYSKTKKFSVDLEPSRLVLQKTRPLLPSYLVPPPTAHLNEQGGG